MTPDRDNGITTILSNHSVNAIVHW